uniref:FAM161 centrosomal protein B n=1 Tax=Neogobius melanostomus TaxID=47308 RepID=A0A8C6SY28_9GOBI
ISSRRRREPKGRKEESMAECLKKFSALPVPRHVTVPLFREMMGKMEEQRKHGHEQRKNFLLSMQKPFGFEEREKERRGKLMAMMNEASQEDKKHAAAVKKSHKIKQDPKVGKLNYLLLCSPGLSLPLLSYCTHIRENARQLSEGPKLRTADRTRRERIGFLDESPSFQPKIIHRVPDFSRLHRALQRETTQAKDTTKCLPFHLRTSALPERTFYHLPSKSLGALTSLSTDTLPVYITDAARKRSQAVRKSIEVRESKESAEWLRKYRMRSEAMQRTVTLHAKLLDPHRSLKEVCNEKLQHHRAADQQRMREYGRELKGMRARVSERPYLFEQVKQVSVSKGPPERTTGIDQVFKGLKV